MVKIKVNVKQPGLWFLYISLSGRSPVEALSGCIFVEDILVKKYMPEMLLSCSGQVPLP